MGALVDQRAYIDRPRWAKWLQRILYVLAYGLFGFAGAIATTLDFPANNAGYVVLVASALAIVGVVTGYYRLEMIAAGPLITAFLAIVLWMQLPEQDAKIAGWLVAAYTPLLGVRFLVLWLLARKHQREARAGGGE